MAEPLVVVGAGGFGRETLDVAEAVNDASSDPPWHIVGVVDDAPSNVNLDRLRTRGVPYLGTLDDIPEGARLALSIGSPRTRRELDRTLRQRGFEFATLVHPSALLGTRLSLGNGSIVCGGVSVGTNVTLGRQVHLNPCAVIGHDVILGHFVSVNPNATVSGDCEIDDVVLVGAASLILQGVRVASAATVGGAACVVRDVSTGSTVKGIPAR